MAGLEPAAIADSNITPDRPKGSEYSTSGVETGTIRPSLAKRARKVVAFDISADAVEITLAVACEILVVRRGR